MSFIANALGFASNIVVPGAGSLVSGVVDAITGSKGKTTTAVVTGLVNGMTPAQKAAQDTISSLNQALQAEQDQLAKMAGVTGGIKAYSDANINATKQKIADYKASLTVASQNLAAANNAAKASGVSAISDKSDQNTGVVKGVSNTSLVGYTAVGVGGLVLTYFIVKMAKGGK